MTVVVASRNRRDELLASLGRHHAPVVLVDNGSTDGTPDAVRRAHPHVDVVALGRNAGAAGRTIGVRRARTPFVAFADDDSWWAPGSLRAAADVLAQHPRVGLLDVRTLIGPEERLDPFCELLAASPLPPRLGDLPGPRILGFMACAAMVRRDAFLAVGGFDEVVRFPGEEERLSWDLTAAGWSLAYLDDAVVHHHPSPRRQSPADRRRAMARSRVLSGVLRLPWPLVMARAAAAWTADRAQRRGVLDATARVPAALRNRRALPVEVLADLDLLARTGPRGPARPAPASSARASSTERR